MFGSILLFFVILSSGSFFGAAIFGRRYEEIVPITACSLVMILFLFGLAGSLLPGVYFVCVAAMVLTLTSGICIFRKGTVKSFCRAFFTPGFFVFLVGVVALAVLHYGRKPTGWDEFTHWASVVKWMTEIDTFVTNQETSQIAFRSYAPGMALFQYFFQKLISGSCPSISFCEWGLYFAYHVFSLTFIMPFFKTSDFRSMVPSAFLFSLIFLSGEIAFPGLFLSTIYIDPFVGFIAGAGTAYLYCSRKICPVMYLYIFLTIAVLVLAKDVGMLFAVFLAAEFLIRIFLFRDDEEKRNSSIIRLVPPGICAVLAVVLPKWCWNAHLRAWNITKSFSSPIRWDVFYGILKGKDQTYSAQVLENYRKLIFQTKPIITWFGIPFTYLMILCSFVAILIVFYFVMRSKWTKSQRVFRAVVTAIALFQTCLYVFGMLAIYLFRFSEYEALRLSSAGRYLGTAFLALQMMVLLIFFDALPQAVSRQRIVLAAVIAVVIFPAIPVHNVKDFLLRSSARASREYNWYLDEFCESVEEKLPDSPCRLYVIVQESDGYYYWALRYLLMPNIVNEGVWSISSDGQPLYEGDIWTEKKTSEEWKSELDGYDFVVLLRTNDQFKKDYADLFSNPFIADGLYRIEHQTQLLEFVS